ncbi:uncharacterized protein LOC110811720 [Carica papaya]|uniref:uncharacterized protein LOC110811720 n=1 Tax=Carica papaya TaxID=3649 RepID=UPI000B8CFAC7|nr:uncharacterized protein LOC110811720 [Carica papaya]
MGGWRAGAALIFNHIARTSKPVLTLYPSLKLLNLYPPSTPSLRLFTLRSFSAIASQLSVYSNESDSGSRDLCHNYGFGAQEDEEMGKIPVKAYFLCTSIDLKGMQAENLSNVVPPTSRSTNYIALKYCDFPSEVTALGVKGDWSCYRYMVVFQYGSAVLFNVEDHEVEAYLEIVRRYASGLLPEMRKDVQLVGKANSNLADVILKVGLFERSEIAWRDAKYAQIYEYLREEYEVTQRFGNLDFKLKFVEHNIHFLQEVMQNRRSDLLEWCIIFLLSIENIIAIYEIVRESTGVSL